MKKTIRILALVMLVITCFAAYGCDKPSEGEVLAAYRELYPKAHELANVIYGDGLAYDGEYDLESLSAPHYVPVSESAPYKTKAELEAAVLAVYSQGFYDDVLKTVMFGGAASDENGMFGIYPRYKETAGVLYVDIKYDTFVNVSERDTDTVRVTDVSSKDAVVSVAFVSNGEQKTKDTTMVLTDKGWRLDEIV